MSCLEQAVGRALREREHKPSIFRLGGAMQHGPDLVGYVNGRRVETDMAAHTPKTCLGCGAKQQHDGSLPCGH